MESETMTKVASRKNMISISGMISMRALLRDPGDGMTTGIGGGYWLFAAAYSTANKQDLKPVTCLFQFDAGFLHASIQIIEG
jgi:hypothetical protein